MSAIVGGVDIETTGKREPDQRIIEVSVNLYRDGAKIWSYEQRINPERSITIDAQRVHGITGAELLSCPKWDTVAPTINAILARCDYLVAHNGDEFDKPFLEQEMKRIGLSLTERPWVDTMVTGVWATPDGKKPRLSELAFACGVDYDPAKAHAAAYDVDVMMECYYHGLRWDFFDAPVVRESVIAQAA